MKQFLKFRTLLNVCLALVLVGAVFKITMYIRAQPSSAAGAVRTTTVKRGTVLSTVSASGNIQSANANSVNFQTSGTVSQIDVAVGSNVTQGQVLAKLDPTAANATLQAARLTLSSAQDKLNQLESDSTSTTVDPSQTATTVSDADIASAQAAIVSAQSQVHTAQQTVSETILKAPADGTITAINGSVGASASASTAASTSSSASSAASSSSTSASNSSSSSSPFIAMADLSAFQVNVGFSEADATKIAVGDPATITIDALNNTEFPGTVTSLDLTSTTVNNVVTYNALVSLNNPTGAIKLGMTSEVAVTVEHADNVLYLPSAAVHEVGTSTNATVTLDKNNKQSTANVTIGLKGDSTTEIKSGLTEGQQVVLSTGANANNTTGNAGTRTTTGAGGGFGGGFGGGGLGGGGFGGGARGGG